MSTPAPAARDRTLAVATRAFERVRAGLATGEWQPFLDLLADDFEFYFPVGRWHGQHRGKAKAAEFLAYVREIYPEGLRLELDRFACNDATAVFEFRDWGLMALPGQAPRDYRNRVAISFDVRGDEVVSYREYFGSDGNSN
jgi:ketosteroid isomerase-like protein